MTTVAIILGELKAAFPAKRAGRFRRLSDSLLGDEPVCVARDFADKDDWTVLESEWLDEVPRGLGSALCFLSNEAICFYIPAFLSAELTGSLRKADPTFHLFHGFDAESRDQKIKPDSPQTWTDYARERWAGLTAAQVRAIVHYLEWQVQQHGVDFHLEIVEALGAYWYPRGAEANASASTLPKSRSSGALGLIRGTKQRSAR